MRVLVTGGAGYIGSVLVNKLIEAGHQVNVLDDLSNGFQENIDKNANFINGSILDDNKLNKALDGVEVVMHLAAKNGRKLDSFVVRKAEKAHGLQRRIEGPDVKGRRVLAVEDTSTTGSSVLAAVEALKEAGAIVVAVAVIVERGAAPKVKEAGFEYRAAYQLTDLDL